jgi:hypothetical protein
MALPGPRRVSASGMREAEPPRNDPTAAAAADLYRACHLRPPAILVACDAVHFGRLVGRLVRCSDPFEAMNGILLGLLLFNVLAASRGDAVTAAYGAFAAAFVPWMLAPRQAHRGNGAVLGEATLRMLISLVLGAVVFGSVQLTGTGRQSALLATGTAMGASVCVQLALALLAPCVARWRLGRTARVGAEPLPWLVVLWGAARADAVLAARLASALHEVELAQGPNLAGGLRGHRGPQQWAMQTAIRDAAQGRGCPSSNALGQSGPLVNGRSGSSGW